LTGDGKQGAPCSPFGLTPRAIACLTAMVSLLPACAQLSPRPDSPALNYVAVSPMIGTAGMPRPEQFETIGRAGFRTVIELATPGTAGSHRDEAEFVTRQGMRYFNVPVDFARPTADAYLRFAALMREHADERVLVHCEMNMRASAFVFLYRVLELGEEADRAYEDVLRVWQPAPHWRRFILTMLQQRSAPLPIALDE